MDDCKISHHRRALAIAQNAEVGAQYVRGISELMAAWFAYTRQTTPAPDRADAVNMVMTWTLDEIANSLGWRPPHPSRRGRRRSTPAPDDNARWLTRRLRELRDAPGGDGEPRC